MVISRIVGGLGNQMFQYAAARRVALKNNAELKLDISGYQNNSLRQFRLNEFNIQAKIASPEEIVPFRRCQKREAPSKILNFLQKLTPPAKRRFVKENDLDFDPQVLKLSGNAYLQGYWQSEKYFKDIEAVVRQEFTLKETPSSAYLNWKKCLENCPSVAVHVRRTDYLSKELCRIYAVCQPEFYVAAAQKLIQLTKNELRFFIFSDDIEWARKNLKFNGPTEFVSQSGLENFEELLLMSACQHNIIANSSFSWWGAWLNKNPKKIIIAPAERLKDKNKNPKDIYPPSWLAI